MFCPVVKDGNFNATTAKRCGPEHSAKVKVTGGFVSGETGWLAVIVPQH